MPSGAPHRTFHLSSVRQPHRAGDAMDDKQLAKLIRKNTAKAAAPKSKQRRVYDATLDATRTTDTDENSEALEFFSEMKKREF
jgi:hypothetical protein